MNEHNPVEISGIDRKQIHADGDWDYIYEHKPIPLTEEWLTRFGFDETGYMNIKSGGIIQVTMNFIGSVMYSINGSHWVDISDCRYVHQLQNLYHALTGEELTIKE